MSKLVTQGYKADGQKVQDVALINTPGCLFIALCLTKQTKRYHFVLNEHIDLD